MSSPLKIWTPTNFTIANFWHPVSKFWLRPCNTYIIIQHRNNTMAIKDCNVFPVYKPYRGAYQLILIKHLDQGWWDVVMETAEEAVDLRLDGSGHSQLCHKLHILFLKETQAALSINGVNPFSLRIPLESIPCYAHMFENNFKKL